MPSLATTADLEARLGRDLTTAEAARADALLADASALVRGHTRQQFSLVVDDQVTLRPVGTVLRLPQRPVTAVTAVVAVGGGTLPDLTLPAGVWAFDGVDKVDIWPPDTGWLLNLPAAWSDGSATDTYRVTYSHGYTDVPDAVVAVVANIALRTLLSPTMVAGMVSERIGQYNYQLQQGVGSVGAAVRLTADDREALAPWRRSSGTIQVRAR